MSNKSLTAFVIVTTPQGVVVMDIIVVTIILGLILVGTWIAIDMINARRRDR